jgi:hypothetical protein
MISAYKGLDSDLDRSLLDNPFQSIKTVLGSGGVSALRCKTVANGDYHTMNIYVN